MIHRVGTLKPRPYVAVPLPPQPLELDACYRYCEALAHSRHHNFPVASRFARQKLRRHFWACYAFARAADDFADEPEYEGRRALELDRWEERLHACYFGEPPDHPVFVALQDTIRRFDLPITEFAALLSGFRTDLDVAGHTSWNDLRGYTARAAEPVGRLLLYLGGYRDPVLHGYCDDLSSGLAIAKLWQDVAADADRGRIYLPREDLRHFGVATEDLVQKRRSPAIGALMRYQVARTRALFERARPLVDTVGPDLATELAIVWHGGMRILDKIQSVGDRILRSRPRLNSADKALAVSRALAWRGGTLRHRAAAKFFPGSTRSW